MKLFTPFAGSKEEGNPIDVSFWLSFSPMAPFFGVKYRFADMCKFDQAFAPKFGMFNFDMFTPKAAEPKPVEAPKKKAAPKAKKVEVEPVIEAAPAVEPEPIVEPEVAVEPQLSLEEPVVEAAPAPVEAPVEAVFEASEADRPATLFDAPPAYIDDLKLIKGVGPKLEGMLNGLGIYTFEQIAGFSPAELQWVDDNLTSFKGRAFRDDWIAQAKSLLA